ncbi:unnamed protein product [Ostreobium quekettii]|uniref:Uncharacterized protein n=1 Tax=Ostreobium quekettii TaxID=121088 RepID=A0A8S1J1V4_9CHLO|nr:unnamed protein product [Ostreobium quekettii]
MHRYKRFPSVCPLCMALPCKKCPVKTGTWKASDNPWDQFCAFQESDLERVLNRHDMERYNLLQVAVAMKSKGEVLLHCTNPDCGSRFTTRSRPRWGHRCLCPKCSCYTGVVVMDMPTLDSNYDTQPNPAPQGPSRPAATRSVTSQRAPKRAGHREEPPFPHDSNAAPHVPPERNAQERRSAGVHEGKSASKRKDPAVARSGQKGSEQLTKPGVPPSLGGEQPLTAPVNCNGHSCSVGTANVHTGQALVLKTAPAAAASQSHHEHQLAGTQNGCQVQPGSLGTSEASSALEAWARTSDDSKAFAPEPEASRDGLVSLTGKQKVEDVQSGESPAPMQEPEHRCAQKSKRQLVVEALMSERHMSHLRTYTGRFKIVCANCSNALVRDIEELKVKASMHIGEKCGQKFGISYGFCPQNLVPKSVSTKLMNEGILACKSCHICVGTVGEYHRTDHGAEVVCRRCNEPSEQLNAEIDVLDDDFAALPVLGLRLSFLCGRNIAVQIGT